MASQANARFAQLQRRVAEAEYEIQQIEQIGFQCPEDRKNEAAQRTNRLLQDIGSFEAYIYNDPLINQTRGPIWRSRIAQLKHNAQASRQTLQHYMTNIYSVNKAEQEREALLNGASATTANAHFIAIDGYSREQASLRRSNQMMDEFSDIANTVYGALRSQRRTLKGAHKRVLDMANTLGLGTSLMRAIERRTTGDKIIVYGGMIVTLVVLYLAYRYTAGLVNGS